MIESKRVKQNKNDYDNLEVEIDYILNKSDRSIITIKIMTDAKPKLTQTDNEVYFLVIYFKSYDKSFLNLNVKWSEEFYFSNSGHATKNKFELISKQELNLIGTEYEENSFHFRYD